MLKIKVKILIIFCLLFFNSTVQAKSPSELIVEIVDKASSILSSNLSDDEKICLLYTSPSPRDKRQSRMPSSA